MHWLFNRRVLDWCRWLRLAKRIQHLLERSFSTVQELNKYRKEIARDLAASLSPATSASPA